jgi:exodeoxyribonuclease VII large subunit
MAQTETDTSNAPEFTVSELSQSLKRTLEDRFGYVRIRGEISSYRGPHSSGHVYFALKDDSARLDAVIWRTAYSRMRIKPEEGLEVIASGKITTFASKSSYQIVVDSIEPAGTGALMALLEARRRQLAAEGLFNADRKRSLPYLPRSIGVVTSPTGSVIRDILHRLADRFPTRVILWPVRVQGDNSAQEIAAAIRGFNALTDESSVSRPDVLIVARGGGSVEDLWSFNDEDVVRAAAESKIPLISAVGHETDWTLIDHAADIRAPTPTAAAELCVPVRTELVLRVSQLEARALGAIGRSLKQRQSNLRATARSVPSIKTHHASLSQRLDSKFDALHALLQRGSGARTIKLSQLSGRLSRQSPYVRLVKAAERAEASGPRMRLSQQRRLSAARETLGQMEKALQRVARNRFELRAARLKFAQGRWESRRAEIVRLPSALGRETARAGSAMAREMTQGLRRRSVIATQLGQIFSAVNYRAVLARGFAMVLDRTGTAVSRTAEARAARNVTIRFADGEIPATVGAPRSRKRATPRTSTEAEQKALF